MNKFVPNEDRNPNLAQFCFPRRKDSKDFHFDLIKSSRNFLPYVGQGQDYYIELMLHIQKTRPNETNILTSIASLYLDSDVDYFQLSVRDLR